MSIESRPVRNSATPSVWGADQVGALTLAAVGFLAYYFAVMWHENVGHGLVEYMAGAHKFILTSTSMMSPDVPLSGPGLTLAGRLVLVAGSVSNIVLAVALYPLFRNLTRRRANIALRLFLWLLVSINFYLGSIYLAYSAVFGVADFSLAIAGLPHQGLLRLLEAAIGLTLSAAAIRFFAVSFAEFPENLWRTALIPYITATVIFCLAGLRNPNGAMMLVSVLPAALLGQSLLLFVTPLARRFRTVAAYPLTAKEREPSFTAMSLAFVFVIIIFITAPGVQFTIR